MRQFMMIIMTSVLLFSGCVRLSSADGQLVSYALREIEYADEPSIDLVAVTKITIAVGSGMRGYDRFDITPEGVMLIERNASPRFLVMGPVCWQRLMALLRQKQWSGAVAYHANIIDGTQAKLVLEAPGRTVLISFNNHFPRWFVGLYDAMWQELHRPS